MLDIRPITHLFMSCIKDGNVNLITTRHVSATLMSAMKENPGANGFIISGISSIKFLISVQNVLVARLPPVHARHIRVPGAYREAGRRHPHQLAPLHPRETDTEWIQGLTALFIYFTLVLKNPQILTHLLFSKD